MSAELTVITEFLRKELAAITNRPVESFDDDSELIGANTVVASREFVELLLAVEDFASDQLGFAFDWTSDSALSVARSHFRTVKSLAEYLLMLSNPHSTS